jgi:hypothetical protein
MFKIIFILFILFPSISNAECKLQQLFIGQANVEVPKPKWSVGDPKPSPELIEKARSIAKLDALENYVSQCLKDDNIKMDRYLSMTDKIKSKIDLLVSPKREEQNQIKKTLKIKIQASINSSAFDRILVGTGRTKKKSRMISLFIARKADSFFFKQYEKKVSKISKSERGVSAEKSATTDGTTTAMNKESKKYSKTQTGGSTETKRENVKESFVVTSSEDLNATIQKVMADFGYKGGKYSSFARKCGAPPTEQIFEEMSVNDMMSDDTEADIFDAIQESDVKRCKRINLFAIAVVTYSNPIISQKTGMYTVEASVRVQITSIPEDDFPEVIASIGPKRKRKAEEEPSGAEKKALVAAGKWAGQQIVDSLKAQGL